MGCFSSRPKCIICDEMAEKILYPCGHYCLCAVCANKLNRPVKMVVAMQTNMETFGKRCPYYIKWKVLKTRQTFLQFGHIVINECTKQQGICICH